MQARQDLGRLPVDGVSDVTAEEHAFVELSAPREAYFVHQPIRLRLRIGFEKSFLQERMLQLFHQPLDVPVQVQAGWLQDLPCTIATPDEPLEPGDERRRWTIALDERVTEAPQAEDLVEDGREFIVLQIEKRILPTCPGELSIPAPLLRLAYATSFREDIFDGRVAADRREAFVHGNPLALRILALPEEGRPLEFGGAVGSFSVRAEASPRNLAVGESLKLFLAIQGLGNLESFDPPRLERLDGFHLQGRTEDRRANLRTITYDLAPLDERVKEVPSIQFVFFDPEPPAGYRSLRTQPIPLGVRPRAGDDTGTSPSSSRAWLLAPCLLGLGLLVWLRVRSRRRPAPDPVDARGTAAALRSHAASTDSDLAQAFAEFLAARLACPVPAVIAPDLQARLVAAGVPAEIASRSAALLESLLEARYGGRLPPGSGEAVGALVESLEVSFRKGLEG